MELIPKRQASDGTRRFLNLIKWAEHHRTPSLLLSLDTEKAFDRVDWFYLAEVLMKFGFTRLINKDILALYSCPSARILTSGMISDPFPISNGKRQGCTLSPLIFAMVIEPLWEAIRSHPSISGMQIGPVVHKIGLSLDDSIVSMTDPSRSLLALHDLLQVFGQVSLYKTLSPPCWTFT